MIGRYFRYIRKINAANKPNALISQNSLMPFYRFMRWVRRKTFTVVPAWLGLPLGIIFYTHEVLNKRAGLETSASPLSFVSLVCIHRSRTPPFFSITPLSATDAYAYADMKNCRGLRNTDVEEEENYRLLSSGYEMRPKVGCSTRVREGKLTRHVRYLVTGLSHGRQMYSTVQALNIKAPFKESIST